MFLKIITFNDHNGSEEYLMTNEWNRKVNPGFADNIKF